METIANRTTILFEEQRLAIYRRTDKLFAVLMVFQWIGAVVAACFISPSAWEGSVNVIHIHVWAAIFLGGALTLVPVYFAWQWPGEVVTRHVIAVGQMLMSTLLIHLTGGRIETHFHVFGSLAFLAFYRDWRVLISASAIVAADHYLGGVYWPQSTYAVLVVSPWRWLEHAFWVIFEDVFLILSIQQSQREMREMASRQAALEDINHDIEEKVTQRTTELETSQLRARQSEKMSALGQLASGVAHEINNPLGVILGFSEGVLRRVQSGDALEMPLKSIQREAIRCKNLVQDLLTFSRTSKVDREPMDFTKAVEGALSLVMAKAKLTQVTILKEFAPLLPSFLGNPNQIQQVIINLATNAIDAMDGRGTLTVKTEVTTEGPLSWIDLRITDTGAGIPKEILPHIFEPFYTTKPEGEGTGLGLALTHEIVVKHSALIAVESRPGRTEFHVRFPVRTGLETVTDIPVSERSQQHAA